MPFFDASFATDILYKSIAGKQRSEAVQKVREGLQRWCDEEKVEPILC